MASIEPAVQVSDDPEAGYGKNEVQQVQIPQINQETENCCGSKKCWIIVLITTVVLVGIGVVLGVVFGVVLKDDSSTKEGSSMAETDGGMWGSEGNPASIPEAGSDWSNPLH